MADLKSRGWIVAKGVGFLFSACAIVALVLFEMWIVKWVLLIALPIWAFCRFYYFLSRVFEHGVDRAMRYRYARLWDLVLGVKWQCD